GFPDLCDRPLFPALFITDITDDPSSRSGDWQFGGTPIAPNAVFGTWKGAVRTVDKTKIPTVITVTPDADPAKNNFNLDGGDAARPSRPERLCATGERSAARPRAPLRGDGVGAPIASAVTIASQAGRLSGYCKGAMQNPGRGSLPCVRSIYVDSFRRADGHSH